MDVGGRQAHRASLDQRIEALLLEHLPEMSHG